MSLENGPRAQASSQVRPHPWPTPDCSLTRDLSHSHPTRPTPNHGSNRCCQVHFGVTPQQCATTALDVWAKNEGGADFSKPGEDSKGQGAPRVQLTGRPDGQSLQFEGYELRGGCGHLPYVLKQPSVYTQGPNAGSQELFVPLCTMAGFTRASSDYQQMSW